MVKYEPFFSPASKTDPTLRENLRRIQKAFASIGEGNTTPTRPTSVTPAFVAYAALGAANVFSKLNTFLGRVSHGSPPEYPVASSVTSSESITWDNDTVQHLLLTDPLTGTLDIPITNPRSGRCTSVSYIQGSVKRTVSVSATGVSFWAPGATSPSSDTLVLSVSDVVNARYSYRLTWYSSTMVVVSKET